MTSIGIVLKVFTMGGFHGGFETFNLLISYTANVVYSYVNVFRGGPLGPVTGSRAPSPSRVLRLGVRSRIIQVAVMREGLACAALYDRYRHGGMMFPDLDHYRHRLPT